MFSNLLNPAIRALNSYCVNEFLLCSIYFHDLSVSYITGITNLSQLLTIHIFWLCAILFIAYNFFLFRRASLSGKSNQNIQVVYKSASHVVEKFGSFLPVIVKEATKHADRKLSSYYCYNWLNMRNHNCIQFGWLLSEDRFLSFLSKVFSSKS